MNWECACGISNADTRVKCAGCGGTKEQVSDYYEKEIDLLQEDSFEDSRSNSSSFSQTISLQGDQNVNVRVVDVKIPFFSMVIFMVKWAIASVPAIIIVAFFWVVVLSSLVGSFEMIFR